MIFCPQMLSKLTKLSEEYNVGSPIRFGCSLTVPRIDRGAYYKSSPMYFLESFFFSTKWYLIASSRSRSNHDLRRWWRSKTHRGTHSLAFFSESYIPAEGYVR